MADPQRLHEIAALLRELVAVSPSSAVGLEKWEEVSARISDRLRTDYGDVALPVQVMHYVNDGDVRAKDPSYAAMQDRVMSEFIAELEGGEVPASRGTTVSFSPWSVVVAAVFVGTVLLLASRSCS